MRGKIAYQGHALGFQVEPHVRLTVALESISMFLS